jgi:hypothetical protein
MLPWFRSMSAGNQALAGGVQPLLTARIDGRDHPARRLRRSHLNASGDPGNMTNPSGLGVDLDLQLLDSAGRVLSSSTSGTPNETVSASIQPNQQYRYRVIGWAGAAQDFQIVSTQSLLVPKAGTSGGQGASAFVSPTGALTGLLRFAFNPVTKTITVQLVK